MDPEAGKHRARSAPADHRGGIRSAVPTRTRIVTAATSLFLAEGYAATSIIAIAQRAEVAVQTVYNSIGSKAALVTAVLENAAFGTDELNGQPMVTEAMRQRAREAVDPPGMIGVLADWCVEVAARTADVVWMTRQAAALDPDVAELEKRRGEERLRSYAAAAAGLRARGALTSGMSDREAAATIWTITHPLVYRSLVTEGGWSIGDYARWVTVALRAALA